MLHSKNRLIVAGLTLSAFAAWAPAQAHQITQGDLTLAHPFVRLDAHCRSDVTRAYVMLIINAGAQADRLVAAELDHAGKGRLIRVSTRGGTPKRDALASGIEIPAKGQAALMPPDLEIEFPKSRQVLMEGGAAQGSLTFQRGGKVAVTFMVDVAQEGQGSTGCSVAIPDAHKH